MISRINPNQRMSMAVTWPMTGKMTVTAGHVAQDRTADVAGQTADILAQLDAALAAAGASKKDIVNAYIWLADISTFDQMNAVWDAWVEQGSTPARACVQATLAHSDVLVEIQLFAVTA